MICSLQCSRSLISSLRHSKLFRQSSRHKNRGVETAADPSFQTNLTSSSMIIVEESGVKRRETTFYITRHGMPTDFFYVSSPINPLHFNFSSFFLTSTSSQRSNLPRCSSPIYQNCRSTAPASTTHSFHDVRNGRHYCGFLLVHTSQYRS